MTKRSFDQWKKINEPVYSAIVYRKNNRDATHSAFLVSLNKRTLLKKATNDVKVSTAFHVYGASSFNSKMEVDVMSWDGRRWY